MRKLNLVYSNLSYTLCDQVFIYMEMLTIGLGAIFRNILLEE